jgi:hypothetical protein
VKYGPTWRSWGNFAWSTASSPSIPVVLELVVFGGSGQSLTTFYFLKTCVKSCA